MNTMRPGQIPPMYLDQFSQYMHTSSSIHELTTFFAYEMELLTKMKETLFSTSSDYPGLVDIELIYNVTDEWHLYKTKQLLDTYSVKEITSVARCCVSLMNANPYPDRDLVATAAFIVTRLLKRVQPPMCVGAHPGSITQQFVHPHNPMMMQQHHTSGIYKQPPGDAPATAQAPLQKED